MSSNKIETLFAMYREDVAEYATTWELHKIIESLMVKAAMSEDIESKCEIKNHEVWYSNSTFRVACASVKYWEDRLPNVELVGCMKKRNVKKFNSKNWIPFVTHSELSHRCIDTKSDDVKFRDFQTSAFGLDAILSLDDVLLIFDGKAKTYSVSNGIRFEVNFLKDNPNVTSRIMCKVVNRLQFVIDNRDDYILIKNILFALIEAYLDDRSNCSFQTMLSNTLKLIGF